MAMIVAMTVIVSMIVIRTPAAAEGVPALPDQPGAHKDHQQTGEDFHDRHQHVGHHKLAGKQRQQADHDH
jgi:hypothetical protein